MSLISSLIRPSDEQREKSPGTPHRESPAVAAKFAELMAGKTALEQNPGAVPPPMSLSTLHLRAPTLAGRAPSEVARVQEFSGARNTMRASHASSVENRLSGISIEQYMKGRVTTSNVRQITPKKAASVAEPTWEEACLGSLSASFESGRDGIAAIGYDRVGGTSYGKYQIASRVGGMKDFIKFLEDQGQASDIAKRLRGAGPANTGSRKGEMPKVWQAIATEQPERFEKLQESFIRESHYNPAVKSIAERTSLKAEQLSPAMREVIWSTAVQHGPTGAARIFSRADSMSGKPTDAGYERKMIQNVYTLRAGQFGSSDDNIQASVGRRFVREKMMALNMLDGGKSSALA